MNQQAWILTGSGRVVNLVEPDANSIELRDICHALANLCRFTGHTERFYSVAEHCLRGAMEIDARHRLEFLLHDAAEAYFGDLSAPAKSVCPDYCRLVANMDRVIRRKYGLPPVMSPEVTRMDLVMLATERRDLLPLGGPAWSCLAGVPALPQRIVSPREMRNKWPLDWPADSAAMSRRLYDAIRAETSRS